MGSQTEAFRHQRKPRQCRRNETSAFTDDGDIRAAIRSWPSMVELFICRGWNSWGWNVNTITPADRAVSDPDRQRDQ